MTRPRVLVVDVVPQATWLCRGLDLEGCTATLTPAGALRDRQRLDACDLVILDLWSWSADTFVSAAGRRPPLTLAIVGDSARDEAITRLESGLDAWLPASAGLPALIAMVRAMLRRRLDATGLEIDVARRRASLHGEPLRLSRQEFQLLRLFANHPGHVFDRETLLAALWGGRSPVGARTVDALIKRLRQRLQASGAGQTAIETVRGVGYRFAESPAGPRVLSLFLLFASLFAQN